MFELFAALVGTIVALIAGVLALLGALGHAALTSLDLIGTQLPDELFFAPPAPAIAANVLAFAFRLAVALRPGAARAPRRRLSVEARCRGRASPAPGGLGVARGARLTAA